MRFANILSLTRGVMLTNPLVSSFSGYSCDAYKTQRANLYIDIQKSYQLVQIAIQKGAYGIITDENYSLDDNEIAYIKVPKIRTALIQLMRYESAIKKLKFAFVDLIQENILRHICIYKSVNFMSNSLMQSFTNIQKADECAFMFCTDLYLLEKIAPEFTKIKTPKHVTLQKNGSIFTSSFIHENEYYQKVPISPIFAYSFCGIISFLKKNEIKYSLESFKQIEHFEPIFVDIFIHPQSFGSTRRALIVESCAELFEYEFNELKNHFSKNTFLTCKKKNHSSTLQVDFEYENEKDLKNLSNYDFKYALVLGDKISIEEALRVNKNKKYPSLF